MTTAVCADEAAARGLTLVDLSDAWTPAVLAQSEASATSYAPTYRALANEASIAGRAPARELELYGVFPTFGVLARRLFDSERHRCHAAIDDSALATVTRTLTPEAAGAQLQAERAERVRTTRAFLQNELRRRGLHDVEELGRLDAHRDAVRRFLREAAIVAAIEAVQAHLRCDRLLTGPVAPGVVDPATAAALRVFQRAHAIIGRAGVDTITRTALLTDSRELVFRAALRVLRERVVDASGLIEDGSASADVGKVLGRELDAPELHAAGRVAAPLDAAPDLISLATEAAARALGWLDSEALAKFLEAHRAPEQALGPVALRLPPPPTYHSPRMELRAEIDRGDVVRAFARRNARVKRRPTLTLFAKRGDGWIALARWNTTIGGWKKQRTAEGDVRWGYKASPLGPRLWRDLIAAPVWLPPASTPDAELVRYVASRDVHVLERELFGPGYRSAYGLIMLVHLVDTKTDRGLRNARSERLDTALADSFGTTELFDQGVRTHGTVDYGSILGGYSHGCHRLWNHLALRLGGFLLRHRSHVFRGSIETHYVREVQSDGRALPLRIFTRGERYELTPPVPVEVIDAPGLRPHLPSS